MKLEAGKSYYRRDGGVESIVELSTKNPTAFNADGEAWYLDGTFADQGQEHDMDLIAEVPSADQAFTETAEAGLSVVRDNSITVYENRGGEVWERHPDGRRELFAEDIIRKLTDLEMQRNDAIEIARRAMETVMHIYGHAQFCDECQSFEIADSCRIQMHGMDRINSLPNVEHTRRTSHLQP